jgi:DNA polymerase (family 10)
MDNIAIAGIFQDIADLLEIKGENKFKVRAYQRVVHTIEELPREIETMIAGGQDLKSIPGVGEAIAGKITEIINTGKLEYYEKLKAEFPSGITTLLEIPGIGPKTAKKLSEQGISSIDVLEKAIQDGTIAHIFRMGDKTSENILRQIKSMRTKDQRIPIGEALPIVEEITNYLQKVPGVRNLTPAGSLRRFRDTVGDIDMMGTADSPEAVIEIFTRMPIVSQILGRGPTKASVVLRNKLQVDLRMVEHDSFGSLLQYFTGSKQHNIILRTRAQKQGLSLNEYGITTVDTGELEKFTDEESFYNRLGLQYMPPEIREGTNEIELAERNEIPVLIQLSDIRGDFHMHTGWSDGQDSVEEMALAAKKLGYEFIAITDHSGGLGVAHGLTPERLKNQIEEVRAVNQKMTGIRVFSGSEVDIRSDGSLDLPDELLDKLDIVIASIHSGMSQSEQQITDRVIAAIKNPNVDCIAHPTCRLIGTRPPVAIDMEAVMKAALKYNKALEINAMPNRLDLKDTHIFRARDLGVKLFIGTDSHSTRQLEVMRFGIGIARRGWCRPGDLLNTMPPDKIMKFSGN